MVAPNGARRTRDDHPALPVTIPEIVACAIACHAAGADAIHAHVRDDEGRHVLDSGRYRELISELNRSVPDMAVQITTEAVGRYSPEEQRRVVRDVEPQNVSVALSEMLSDGDDEAARRFYHETADAGIAVQHILYAPEDLDRLFSCRTTGIVPDKPMHLMFVLGRYTPGQESDPDDLRPFLDRLAPQADRPTHDWAVCAFGRAETICLETALRSGGKARVGFENSLWNRDGSRAADNAERVREIAALLPVEAGSDQP